MFSGKIHHVLVKDTKLRKIKNFMWDVETEVNGRPLKMVFDFNPANPKELVDKELCLAIVNPAVHKVTFWD